MEPEMSTAGGESSSGGTPIIPEDSAARMVTTLDTPSSFAALGPSSRVVSGKGGGGTVHRNVVTGMCVCVCAFA